jgi:hypothetical protein
MELLLMEYAYRLLNGIDMSGGVERVDGVWLIAKGRSIAASYNYVCAVAGCHITMFPVIPMAAGSDGRIRRSHFATRNCTHIGHGLSNCVGDPSDTSTRVHPYSLLPVAWRDRQARSPGKNSGCEHTNGDDRPHATGGASTSSSGVPGTKSISSIQRLVDIWLAAYPDIIDKPFRMDESLAATWGDLFRTVDTSNPISESDRRVWFGRVRSTQMYGSRAILIHLSGESESKPHRVYIKSDVDIITHQKDLVSLLKRCDTRCIQAFVLGRRLRSAEIQTSSINHLYLVDRY